MKFFFSIRHTYSRTLVVAVQILLTSKALSQWNPQWSGTTEQLNDVAIVGSASAVAVGNNGVILKTTDRGATWLHKSSGTSRSLQSVSFFYSSGYAVGAGVICHSSDGGETWGIDSSSYNFTVVDHGNYIHSDVYMGSESGVVQYRETETSPWQERALSGGNVVAIGLTYGAAQSMEAYTVTASFMYHNRYSLWDSTAIPQLVYDVLTGGSLRRPIKFLVGWTGNPPPFPYLMRKVLDDTTWQRFSLPGFFIPRDVHSSWYGDIVFVCGSKRTIHKSIDSGATWSLQYGDTGDHSPAFHAMAFHNDSVGYAVGDSGLIFFTLNGGITSVKDGNSRIDSYTLFQNYPNPFNPTTNISYLTPLEGHVVLKLYDITGREVRSLVDQVVPAGHHTVLLDGTTLASGAYQYRFIAGSCSATRNLILVK